MGQEIDGRSFHIGAGADDAERLDRLQDEVARIGRMLADLMRQGGSVRAPFDPPDKAAEEQRALPPPAASHSFSVGPRDYELDQRIMRRHRAKAVRRMLRQRRMREQHFPADLFADPAWDMLLDLYAAQLERHPVSVSSLCIAAAVPATTALRWIKTMTDAGLCLRKADPLDGRRIFIGLADATFEGMERYFEALDE
ncbi:hypothetical protein BWQ93_18490 [Sphingopyxis sp. QXT-31]|nr:hypothetical protein BWQ93_18490 [Sphingopyxis sp. QXT-31]